jgi:hypothetical protein
MSQIIIQLVAVIIAAVAAVAAVFAAAAAWRAARATRQTTQAQLLSSLLDDYAGDEMLKAMVTLRRWKQDHGDQFADEFRSLRQKNYSEVEKVDHARRRVSHYFQKIHTLHTAGLMDEHLVRKAATEGQVKFFREVVEPLEAAFNPKYDRSSFKYLGDLYDVSAWLPPMANP